MLPLQSTTDFCNLLQPPEHFTRYNAIVLLPQFVQSFCPSRMSFGSWPGGRSTGYRVLLAILFLSLLLHITITITITVTFTITTTITIIDNLPGFIFAILFQAFSILQYWMLSGNFYFHGVNSLMFRIIALLYQFEPSLLLPVIYIVFNTYCLYYSTSE